MQPHMQQAVCFDTFLSGPALAIFASVAPLWDRTRQAWAPIISLPIYLGPLLVGNNWCIPGKPNKTCDFGNTLT